MRVLCAVLAVVAVLVGPMIGEQIGLPQIAAAGVGIIPAVILIFPITMPRAPVPARILVVVVAALVVFGILWLL